ncbi:MAG TPA: dTDP-4-dehydrorhamnose 3,5-epimerase [Elusimicrobia bacterium]|nr:dTDP-4-dehydrorhamnose 3,5-epimerase [Elusimicrobiota bacterium]
MRIINTGLTSVHIIEPTTHKDLRGSFAKFFNSREFGEAGLERDFRESYYSVSAKNVIRGMHFQVPPADHSKLVYVPHGAILDVVLDIRKKSKTYGKFIETELSGKNSRVIYIPKGCAHGFLSLEDGSVCVYMQTSVYSAANDCGIKWDSFGMDWPCSNPGLSDRDRSFLPLCEYTSPF